MSTKTPTEELNEWLTKMRDNYNNDEVDCLIKMLRKAIEQRDTREESLILTMSLDPKADLKSYQDELNAELLEERQL